MNIIMLGAPGCGKGTQAESISKQFGIPSISTGNIIRDSIKKGDVIGKKAKSFVDAGGLVPDEVVIEIIKIRINEPDCTNGFVLDGFPRTILQAQALDSMGVEIDKVLSIEVSTEEITSRMSGRRVCEKCGSSYHIKHKKSAVPSICDLCNGTLVQRADDSEETVKDRLQVYKKQTEPLKSYYQSQKKLESINGEGTTAQVTQRVFTALGVNR